MKPELYVLRGPASQPYLPDLARLRLEVFREYPYLYDGRQDEEERYLQTYLNAPELLLVLAKAGNKVVGASTAIPLRCEPEGVKAPFLGSEFQIDQLLYLGESVLLPEYRGQGLGHTFFDQREAHAQALGLSGCTFCAVVRPEDHPQRPQPYRTHQAFWMARGYVERPDLQTTLTWRDLGEAEETPKLMRFWVRSL